MRQSSGEKLNHEVVMIKEAAAAAPLLNDSVPFRKSNTSFYLLCNEADSQLKDPGDRVTWRYVENTLLERSMSGPRLLC